MRKLDFLLHTKQIIILNGYVLSVYDLCEFVMFHAYKIFRCEKDCKLEVYRMEGNLDNNYDLEVQGKYCTHSTIRKCMPIMNVQTKVNTSNNDGNFFQLVRV